MRKEINLFARSVSVLWPNLKRSTGLASRAKPALKFLPVLLAACFAHAGVHANPVGPQVVNGKVIFNKNGNLFTITNTPGAIINWQDFSIDVGEVTRFLQENANSTVLNRVVGQNPSQILGALQSNGRVFLINPNGVLFGKGAQVDVNGLTVSSLGMSDADFKAGKMNFDAGAQAGKVSNQGAITTPTGGHVYLIAPDVENSGIITSPNGEVLLAAGRSVRLVDSANPDLHVVVSADQNQAVNLGQVIAQGGRIGIYGALVSQRGLVSANSAVVGDNGKIYFKASQDTILDSGSVTTATGKGKGGDVQILGQRVALAGNAQVDASGNTGGGQVLLGGDYHGENPAVINAKRAFVSSDAKISADALNKGDGGKVIVWSDEVTRVNGSISARGGTQGGNGGFVETSGKQNLDFRARVNVSAADGKGGKNGTLLLDPASITIAGGSGDGASDGTSTFQGSAIGTINFADGSPTTVYQSELQGLTPGTNIVLEAINYIDTSGTFFGGQINLPSNSNLTLRTRNASTDVSATRGINLTGADPNLTIKTAGTGTITMQTGTGASPQTADIVVGNLNTNSAQINLNASGKVAAKTLKTTPGTSGVGGDIVVNASGMVIFGSGGVDARGNSAANANVTITSGADVGLSNGATIYANDLKMTAVTGLHGSNTTDNLVLKAAKVNALNTGSGDIRLASTAANLVVGDVGSTGYGVKQQSSGQAIFLSSPTTFTAEIGAPVLSNNGAITINGLAGVNQLAGGNIVSAGGVINLTATDGDALSSTAAGTQINSSGAAIAFKSDKMDLLGNINAGTGSVTLQPNVASVIHLATVATNATGSTLELSAAELNRITAAQLKIGSLSGGAIDIKGALGSGAGGALQNVSTSLTLNSGGNISQQAGAIIDGASSLQVRGYGVTLTEANTIGVISGSGNLGGFSYRSINPINITTVDGYSGLAGGSSAFKLTSDGGISQTGSGPVTGSNLALQSKGNVNLTNTGNSFGTFAADLNPGGTGSGSLNLYNSSNLSVATASSITGITTNNQAVTLTTGSGASLDISANVNAGTAKVGFIADQLSLSGVGGITAGDFGVRTFTSGRAITVGSGTCTVAPCLNVINLYKVNAANVAIGSDSGSDASGPVSVVAITDTNASAASDIKHLTTTRVALLSGSGITQVNPITVSSLALAANGSISLNSPNVISSLAVRSGSSLSLVNTQGINVTSLSGANGASSYSLSGITAAGNTSLTASTGNLSLGNTINAGTGTVTLAAPGGAIAQSGGTINGGALDASAAAGIGHGSSLQTKVPLLLANNSGSNTDIKITNTGALNIQNVQQSTPGSTGNIVIDNTGAITLNSSDAVRSKAGSINLIAHSPLTVNGTVTSANGGNITLEAGASGSTADKLTVGSTGVVTTSGNILLRAGDAILVSGTVNGGTVTQQAFLNAPVPTLEQCIASPSTAGCSSVLPSLSACISNPNLVGCSVVLPSVAACQASPTLAGCSVVIPSLSSCIANPALYNCSLVLPSLAACQANPNLAGCSAVLPTLASCLISPTTPGCNLVLPSLSSCISNASQPGCSAVLPTLAQCTANPTTSGCSVVLPALAACLSAPNIPGCSAVLPSIAACTANPSLAGCSAVLPTLSACISNSSLPGCSAVLPTLAACTATPSLPGCSAVLPSLSACIAQPSLAGCSNVLPTLAACQANPSLSGCSAVLPSLTACIANPALAGCSAVLPTLAACQANPNLTGCSAVVPTLSACIANPALSGCSSILPTLAACTANPALPGCSAVLPSLSACIATPTLAGCGNVLPTLSACSATPSLPGCSVVLPGLSSCIANPGLPGCSVVLPGLAACIAAPGTPGCSAVLPSLASCVANPALNGCSAVLPSLAACTATPSTAGCSAVLPGLSVCIANPAVPGCSAVLPSLASCVSAPFTAGCSAVLPTIATCAANPATPGCSVVLPTLASCIANPTLSACSAVLPSQALCAANPGLQGCTLVLPIGDLRTGGALNNGINFAIGSLISSTLNITNSISNPAYLFDSGASDSGRETRFEPRSSFSGGRDYGVFKNATDKKLYCN